MQQTRRHVGLLDRVRPDRRSVRCDEFNEMGLALSGHGNDPALTTVDLTGPRW
jgi:hypothetical protein